MEERRRTRLRERKRGERSSLRVIKKIIFLALMTICAIDRTVL